MADGSGDRLDASIDSGDVPLDTTDPNLATTAPPPSTPLPLSSSSHADDHAPTLPADSASPDTASLPSLSDLSALSSYFDLPATVAFIQRHQATRVALQFPDSLLSYSAAVSHLLSSSSASSAPSAAAFTCYVLADTAFSPCCVDVTSAAHISAEVVVHYGLACLSCQYRLPVHYVFGRAPLDVEAVAAAVCDSAWRAEDGSEDGKGVLLFSDLEYEWAMESVREAISRRQKDSTSQCNIVVATVREAQQMQAHEEEGKQVEERKADESVSAAFTHHSIDGHHFSLPADEPLSSFILFFLGSATSPLLTDLMLNYNSLPTYLLTPPASSSSSPAYRIAPASSSASIRRTLSRRYYLTQHLLSARIYGLLVTALSHSALLSTLARLRQLVASADKRAYTFMMGKPNPSKLANISEVDVWVVLGCPFSALLGGSGGQYFKELVTPVELEMGLTGRLWTGDYCTDMATVGAQRPGQRDEGERKSAEQAEEEAEVVFDSSTGKLRSVLPSVSRGGTQLVVREEGQLVRSAQDVMKERSWRGLETEADRRARMESEQAEDAADGSVSDRQHIDLSTLEHGLQGIASQYSKDETHAQQRSVER